MAIELQLKQHSPTSMKLVNDQFAVIVDRPISKGGGGTGLMGGQHLLMGIAGCFCSNLFAASQARDILLEGVEVHITAQTSDTAPPRFTEIQMDVSYAHCSDPDSFPKLLQIAEKGCISVNTVKNSMSVRIQTEATVNG